MARKPYSDTRLVQYLEKRILEMRPVTQNEIAMRTGFTNPNMLAMIKSGATKLPLDRAPALAQALEADEAYVLRLALEQAVGDTAAKAIIDILGSPISQNERGWISEIREASRHVDPRLTSRARAALRGIFGK
ncbi:XRE family transcriptional regulator [Cereibacter sphaeroides]|uniref:XRE family transcriptional regulator n=2 Tax=Cereibacter sphaeroides TaxID=1063 RepID=A0AAX1UKU1_CERSP|nr:XRE family transcriptional regulator [Cereibacter sphaeroides]